MVVEALAGHSTALEFLLLSRNVTRMTRREVGGSGTGAGAHGESMRSLAWTRMIGVLLLLCYGLMQFGHLAHPLVWQDEGETVMFGQRILEYGYPKVHDGRNVVYGMGVPLGRAVDEQSDAYLGSLWGQYYAAALGVWLAEGTDDPYRRTFWLRLPFALAGAAGVLMVGGLLFVTPLSRAQRGLASAGYMLLVCTSISLQLHIREVRYYALVVLCVAIFLHLHGAILSRMGAAWPRAARLASLQGLVLLLLFNVFYPAAVALAIWLGLEALLRSRREQVGLMAGLVAAWPLWVPALALAVLALPLVLRFEMLELARLYSARYEFGIVAYMSNLRALLEYLLRFEWLGLVVLCELALGLERRWGGDTRLAEATGGWRAAIARLCIVWSLIGARNPIFFERYFIALSPLLSLWLVLGLSELSRATSGRARRLAMATLGITFAALLGVKSPELVGRVHELREPYRGPLDFVIPDLLARYPDASALTLATNYEAEPFMYYLGARVVGRFHDPDPDVIAAEKAVRVDAVIPRKTQRKHVRKVYAYLAQGEFERREYPVQDLPYNNIPELFEGRVLRRTHLFETQHPAPGSPSFFIQERLGGPAGSEGPDDGNQ